MRIHIKIKHTPHLPPPGQEVPLESSSLPLLRPKQPLPFVELQPLPTDGFEWKKGLASPSIAQKSPLNEGSHPYDQLGDVVSPPVDYSHHNDPDEASSFLVSHHSVSNTACGSLYFSLINNPLSPPDIFLVKSLAVGEWSQRSYDAVDVSLHLDHQARKVCYYIEDCTLPLDSLTPSTTLKVEFLLESISEFMIEKEGNEVILILSLKFPPCFFTSSLPRGQVFAASSVTWSPTKDFTQDHASRLRYHMIRLSDEDLRTEARLKGSFKACKIPWNSEARVQVTGGEVISLEGQLSHGYSLLHDQCFLLDPSVFSGDDPLQGTSLPSIDNLPPLSNSNLGSLFSLCPASPTPSTSQGLRSGSS